jgi:hypothetical protein
LCVFIVETMRSVLRTPPHAVPIEPEGTRIMMRRFGWVVTAEVAAFFVVARVCLAKHHWAWIVPLDLMVVGLHFLPLASLFRVPRYYAVGALFCVIPALTMVLIPATAHVGHALSWVVLPSLGCAMVALATAGLGLAEVRRSLAMKESLVRAAR